MEKVLETADQQEYERWLTRVLRPFSAALAQKDVKVLFDEPHDRNLERLGLVSGQSDVARLLRSLLRMRAFAETQCAQTLKQRGVRDTQGRRGALPQLERDVRRIYAFLSRHNRAERYGIDLSQLSINAFLSEQRASALCSALRRGVQSEIRHALHHRLALYLQQTPIGGQNQRKFDVEPLLRFALVNRFEHLDDEALYSLFVDEKMRRMQRALDEQGSNDLQRERDLGEEQFELMRGAPAAPKPILTENNQTCIGPCAASRKDLRKVCRTEPYRKFGLRYTWDYCD